MNRIITYLAGDIDRSNHWRARVIEECQDCPIDFLSPIDNVLYSHQSLAKHHLSNKTFQIEDILKIEKADIVFAYIQKGSQSVFSGTSFEIGYAMALGKKVIVVCDMSPAQAHLYEMVVRMSHVAFDTLDEGINGLRHIALSMIYKPKEE